MFSFFLKTSELQVFNVSSIIGTIKRDTLLHLII